MQRLATFCKFAALGVREAIADRSPFPSDLRSLPGDPADEIDSVVAAVVAAHSIGLLKLAREHRGEILRLAEKQRPAPKWRQ
jgi:hypothetical protein